MGSVPKLSRRQQAEEALFRGEQERLQKERSDTQARRSAPRAERGRLVGGGGGRDTSRSAAVTSETTGLTSNLRRRSLLGG